MAAPSLAPSALPDTRTGRGITLYLEHGDEIEPLGHGRYTVPGCSGGTYTVDLAVFGGEETCSCPDRAATCKHQIAATLYRAKSRARQRANSRRRVFSSDAVEANLERLVASS